MAKKKGPFNDENEINRKSDEIETEWKKYRRERQRKKLPYKNIGDWLKGKEQLENASKAKKADWPTDMPPVIVFSKAVMGERTVGVFGAGESFGDANVQPTIAISERGDPILLLRPINKKTAQAMIDVLQEWIDLQS